MNGPEHYAEAEKRLAMAEETYWDEQPIVAALHLADAQAHATLALAAATMDVAGATSNGVVTAGWASVIQP